MNYRVLFFSLLLVLSLQTISAQSTNRNFSYSTRNLTAAEAYLSLDGEPYLGKEFPLDGNVQMLFEGVKGYQLQSGKAYPRISVSVVEKKRDGQVVLHWENLLEDYEKSGITPAQAAYLSASLTIGAPMQLGEAYQWQINITEATGKGQITLKYDFVVVEPLIKEEKEEAFLYNANEMSVDEIALEIDEEPWFSYDLPDQEKVNMVFKGVQGFSERDGLIFPGMAVRVSDTEGNIVLNAADLFADYGAISAKRAQRLVSKLTIGAPMQVDGAYLWEVYIWDKKQPEHKVEARLNFRVKP